MTIRKQYNKVRRNYLARVRALEKQGYQVERIAIPKNPTRASISRLQKQTSANLKQKSAFIDVFTGEILEPKGKSERKKFEKRNRKNTAFMQDISKQMGKPLDVVIQSIPTEVDLTIDNFYDSIDSFIPPLQSFIKAKIDELLGDNSPERRQALEKALKENPEYVPTPDQSSQSSIAYKFTALADALRLNLQEIQKIQELAGTDGIEME
jgi:hypothetical protein